jgi:succinate dehydrogenase / fumarate reductase iron-sulfur subunit
MKERVVDRRYDPLVWLGRRILRRDQVEQPVPAAPTGPAAPVAPAGAVPARPGPPGTPARPVVVGRVPLAPALGEDGKLPLSETRIDRPGAASPFGDDVTFPVPTDRLTYQHPERDED